MQQYLSQRCNTVADEGTLPRGSVALHSCVDALVISIVGRVVASDRQCVDDRCHYSSKSPLDPPEPLSGRLSVRVRVRATHGCRPRPHTLVRTPLPARPGAGVLFIPIRRRKVTGSVARPPESYTTRDLCVEAARDRRRHRRDRLVTPLSHTNLCIPPACTRDAFPSVVDGARAARPRWHRGVCSPVRGQRLESDSSH